MPEITLPEGLPGLVRARFESARESGALTFWPTEVEVLQVGGIPVSHSPIAQSYR
jgi:hypothetical protein